MKRVLRIILLIFEQLPFFQKLIKFLKQL